MDIDQIFAKIGDFGFRQKLLYFYGCLIGSTYVSGQMLQIVFSGAEPDFLCFIKEEPESNTTNSYYMYKIEDSANNSSDKLFYFNNSCPASNNPKDCFSITYTSPFTSIVTEWDLICQEAYKVQIVEAIFMTGVLVGNFLFGTLSDRNGRRNMLGIAFCGLIMASTASGLVPSYLLHLLLRLVAGMMTGGVGLCAYVWVMELVGSTSRAACSVGFQALFPVGMALHSFIAWLCPDWRINIMASSLYGLFLLAFIAWVPESPRWLLLNGDRKQAEQVLKDIARGNGRADRLTERWHLADPVHKSSSHSLGALFHPALRWSSVIQIYSWFVNSLVYYAMTLAAGSLGTNLYTTIVLSGLVELPGYAINAVVLDRFGRKRPLIIFMALSALTCFLLDYFPASWPWSKTGLALWGKLCIAASFSIIFIHSAEIFPTAIRNSGLGVTSLSARLGGIFAPFASLLDTKTVKLRYPMLGLLSLSAGVLNTQLPETLGRPLPDTLEDLQQNGRHVPDDTTSLLRPTS